MRRDSAGGRGHDELDSPPAAPKATPLIAFRIFAVLAAALLVGAIALGTLAPAAMSLREALNIAAPDLLSGIQHALTGRIGTMLWADLISPVLVRPLWLLPTSLGLVCAGAAATCFPPPSGHTNRRRS
jgi:hypothetical protein